VQAWALLYHIALLITAALVLGLTAERLKQNAIVGYLLTGVLLGPGGLGLVASDGGVEMIADLGVALLLFTIGLEFSWRRLKAFGRLAVGGGTLQVLLTLVVFTAAFQWSGLSYKAALVLGAAVSMSSTALVLRVLTARAELDSLHGRNALGILLLQDMAVVPLVLVVNALGGTSEGWGAAADFGLRLGKGALLVTAVVIAGRYLLPPTLNLAASLRNRELPILLALAVFLLVTWASHALEQSPILGAFIAGMLLAETVFAEQIRADVIPLRAGFVTVFFASVGLLVELPEPGVLLQAALLAAAIVAGKTLIVSGVVGLFRLGMGVALATGLALAQIGEFSFVLGETARQARILPQREFQLFLVASLLTLLAAPYLIGAATAIPARWLRSPARALGMGTKERSERGHVIVVGFGPAGQAVVSALQELKLPFLVLELNPNTVAAWQPALAIALGDATQPEILEHAGLARARGVVVTVPDTTTVRRVIHQVKTLAPAVRVIARARHHIAVEELAGAGADAIVDEEEITGRELGRRLAESL
jgi:CPA2 family monovalent cation:H+ antiporter-2